MKNTKYCIISYLNIFLQGTKVDNSQDSFDETKSIDERTPVREIIKTI